MFITERQNYNESALFLLAARSTLSEIVNQSSSKSKRDLIEFIHNEASDFEIMSLVMTGTLPKVKYSVIGEKYLFSKLKEGVLRNFRVISEAIGENTLNTFIHEVDSVYPKFSTQKPVLEFYTSVQEQSYFSRVYGPSAKGLQADPKDQSRAYKDISDPKDTSPAVGGYSPDEMSGAEAGRSLIDKALDPVRSAAGSENVSRVMNILTGPIGMGAGAVALATLVTYAAYKVYKNFFSKAAKACAGKKGAEKDACMQSYKVKAKQAQAKVLMNGMTACKKSKDPAKCKAAIQAKIAKLKK